MKALVTGGTGFIGCRLVQRLLADGAEVAVLARHPSPRLAKGARLIQGDLLDAAALAEACQGCDRLFHLAALVTFAPGRREEVLRVNAQGTAGVLAAARRAGVERSVVASSARTLGVSESSDQVRDETAAAGEQEARDNPYLASKLEAERLARQAAEDHHVVIANPTTVYGPGDWSLNSGSLVLQVARARLVPVPPGGSNVVDVDDVAAGLVAAAEQGQAGRRYVLGGANLSFAEIVQTIAEATGRRPRLARIPRWMRRPAVAAAALSARLTGSRFLTPAIVSDLFAYKYYSSARAQRELGWTARRSFSDSVARAWSFYKAEGLA